MHAILSALETAIRTGKPAPDVLPDAVPLRSIQKLPGLFQVRSPYKKESEAHVREMRRPLARGTALPPVVVMWGGGGRYRWVCVDGHHRLNAYAQEKWKKPVPVHVFEGTVHEAVHEAARANTPPTLTMRADERSEVAWRLVQLGESSKAKIVESANVSDGTVAKMRRAQKTLSGAGHTPDTVAGMSWEDARRLAEGILGTADPFDEDPLTAKERQYAAMFVKTYGSPLTQSRASLIAGGIALAAPSVVKILREGYVRMDEEDE